ncbi:MAG: glycine cleavage system protein GcvH [Spirochaetota bacterium]
MNVPQNLRYTTQHEWVLARGDTAVIGITDHAQQMLGDVVFVGLPEVGTELTRGESFGVVESVKAASDVYAPVSGVVAGINQELEEHPEHVNQSPYEKGWMLEVNMRDPGELEQLLDPAGYQEFVLSEQEKG